MSATHYAAREDRWKTYPGSHASNQAQTVARSKIRARTSPGTVRSWDVQVAQVGQSSRRASVALGTWSSVKPTFASTQSPCRADWSATLPILSKFFAEFLAGRGPIVADALTQLCNVSFEVQLIFLEPGDIQFLTRGAALELASNIFLVVSDDPVGTKLIAPYHDRNRIFE